MNWAETARTAAEVLILSGIIYAFIRYLQETRGSGVLKGLVLVVVVFVLGFVTLVRAADLQRLRWLADRGFELFLIALLVVFQPELRQALVSLGESPLVRGFTRRRRRGVTEELMTAVDRLSRLGLGALILIERGDGLGAFTEGAVKVDALLSAELLVTLFFKDTPLHDGAAVIRGDRVVAAGCLLPLSENPNLSAALGTRHRAALGITEESDVLAIVVSEETRRVSIASRGRLELDVKPEKLREILELPAPAPEPDAGGAKAPA